MTYLEYVISKYEEKVLGKWIPDSRFYERVGINQKRFGMLVRNELEMSVSEANSLSKFFGVSITEFIAGVLSKKGGEHD